MLFEAVRVKDDDDNSSSFINMNGEHGFDSSLKIERQCIHIHIGIFMYIQIQWKQNPAAHTRT